MAAGLQMVLRKAFDIRPGEYARALLMQLNIFLIITTLLIVKPTVNGLFVSRFGAEGLPKAYLLVAVFAVLVSTLYARLMSRSSLLRMILGTFVVNVIVLAGFGLLLEQQVLPGWELYLIYVWVAVFGVFSASQFWILANILFNAREAKRLFGFIGSGAIIGGILGGYVTHWLAPVIGSEQMLFVAAGLLALCIPITLLVWKRYIKNPHHHTEAKRQATRHVSNPLRVILGSSHLTSLAAIIAISVIVAKLADYQYSDIAAQKITDQDELTSFFGFWFSNFSILSLVFQLFLTRRILSWLGVGGALLFLPGGIFLGAVALIFFPELWAAILIKAADGSLKQSVNKAAIELLAIPIPLAVKKRTKTFIDVVVDSVATGIGGLILIFLVSGLNLSTGAISIMIIALLLGWGYFAFRVRKDYLDSFRKHILHLRPGKKKLELSGEGLVRELEKLLRSGADSERLWVLAKIRELEDEQFFEPAQRLLDDPSPTLRAEALRTLTTFHRDDIKDRVWPLTEDPNPEVRTAALDYLAVHDHDNIMRIRDLLLDDGLDYRISGPVMVTLASETSHNPKLRKQLGVETFIRERARAIPAVKDPEERQFRMKILARGIGEANIPSTFTILEDLMRAPEIEVVREAILAAGQTGDPHFIPTLAAFLGQKNTRPQAIEALVRFGPSVLQQLERIIAEPGTDRRVIQMATEVAERLETPEAVAFLFKLADHPYQGVQIEALRSLTDLKRNFPDLKLDTRELTRRILDEAALYEETLSTLYAQTSSQPDKDAPEQERHIQEARQGLIHLLEHRLENHFERIFRLLGLWHSPDDFSIFFKLRNGQMGKRDIQANAIEFLENLLHPSVKKVVIPVVESSLSETLTEEVLDKFNIQVPPEYDCFAMLLDGNDVRIKLAIFYLIEQMEDPAYLPLVEPFTHAAHPKVRDYAARVSHHLTEKPSPPQAD